MFPTLQGPHRETHTCGPDPDPGLSGIPQPPLPPPPWSLSFPAVSREGGLSRTPSPWEGNYATLCLPNQKHALGKGGEGNFVIGFN